MNSKHTNAGIDRQSRTLALSLFVLAAALIVGISDASAGRGGGGRGGGGGGRGGGHMAQSSIAGANRSASRPSGGAASGGNRASAGNRANTGDVNRGNRANTGDVNSGNRANTGNINSGNRTNTGNINTGNVNVGNDVNVNIDGGYGYHGGGVYHPIAAGVAIGAVAVTTAAVLGSYYRTLPPSCTTVVRSGVSYYYCGSVYYQQTWSGNDVVYVVVNP